MLISASQLCYETHMQSSLWALRHTHTCICCATAAQQGLLGVLWQGCIDIYNWYSQKEV